MTDIKTIIVVGAGASAEFGFPVGRSLLTKISYFSRLNYGQGIAGYSHNGVLIDFLRQELSKNHQPGFQSKIREACDRLSNASPLSSSIDRFLHIHREDDLIVYIGKICISAMILQAESQCSLAPIFANPKDLSSSQFNIQYQAPKRLLGELHADAPVDTWIVKLFRVLAEGQNFQSFCERLDQIAFVCFNYDRCIERFFLVASRDFFPKDQFDAKVLLESINIVHPYGVIGSVPPRLSGREWFGVELDLSLVTEGAKNIRTFTESIESDIRNRIQNWMSEAKNIVYLGYGFLALNNQLLGSYEDTNIKSIYATGYGLSQSDRDTIDSIIRNGVRPRNPSYARVQWLEGTCSELFDRYQMTLGSQILGEEMPQGFN